MLDLLVQEIFWLVIAVVQGADRLSAALNQYDVLKDAFAGWLRKCADAVDGGLEL